MIWIKITWNISSVIIIKQYEKYFKARDEIMLFYDANTQSLWI